MIQCKQDLAYYISQDRLMNGYSAKSKFGSSIKELIFPNIIACLRYMRKLEYYRNVTPFGHKYKGAFYNFLFRRASRSLGFSIGLNSCGPGLSLPHYGTIIISAEARLGKNCRVHACVNIGASGGGHKAPQIGDNVYIGPSCVLFGDIFIADNVTIGANATVNKSCEECNVTIAGTPAKIVKQGTLNWIEFNKIHA